MSALLAHGLETVPCSLLGDNLCFPTVMHCGSATPHPFLRNLFSAQDLEVAVVFRAESCFLLAASLWPSRRRQEQSSSHLPKFRAPNLWAQCGGEVKANQVPQLLPGHGD